MLENKNIERIIALFKNEDRSSVWQAVELVETLCDSEEYVRQILQGIKRCQVAEQTLQKARTIFPNATVKQEYDTGGDWPQSGILIDTGLPYTKRDEEKCMAGWPDGYWIAGVFYTGLNVPEEDDLGYTLPEEVDLFELEDVFNRYEEHVMHYLCIWALGILAQWNETVRKKCTEIERINISLKWLPESIGNLTYLEDLCFESCALTCIPDSIGKLENLTRLGLHGNQIAQLPDSIGNLTKLRSLDLSNNKITNLPESFCRLRDLRDVCLDRNQLMSLPNDFGDLENIVELALSRNQLTELPESLSNIVFPRCGEQMIWIDLSYNPLQTVPSAFRDEKNREISGGVSLDLWCTHISQEEESELYHALANSSHLRFFRASPSYFVDLDQRK